MQARESFFCKPAAPHTDQEGAAAAAHANPQPAATQHEEDVGQTAAGGAIVASWHLQTLRCSAPPNLSKVVAAADDKLELQLVICSMLTTDDIILPGDIG